MRYLGSCAAILTVIGGASATFASVTITIDRVDPSDGISQSVCFEEAVLGNARR